MTWPPTSTAARWSGSGLSCTCRRASGGPGRSGTRRCGSAGGQPDGGLAEWMMTGPRGRRMLLQISYFDRSHEPVTMDVGPVLDLDDVVASLGGRPREPRCGT
jgi:hypothetical protein